jgi:hypothetical protein
MFCHLRLRQLVQPRFPAVRQNIAVDKSYKTKVKVMVRNITPKARSSNIPNFRRAPIKPLADILG